MLLSEQKSLNLHFLSLFFFLFCFFKDFCMCVFIFVLKPAEKNGPPKAEEPLVLCKTTSTCGMEVDR